MKRDWDVVRELLLALEEKDDVTTNRNTLPGRDQQVVAYHIQILGEARLIHGGASPTGHEERLISHAFRLTWSGHELLDKMRDDTTWNKIKHKASSKGVDLSFQVIGMLAKYYAREHLKLALP
ncbi:MAG: DUF2513 domain-containing protein [Rhodanobacter sp.]